MVSAIREELVVCKAVRWRRRKYGLLGDGGRLRGQGLGACERSLSLLRRRPLAGPVGIDPGRFGAFARLIGLDEERAPAARPP